MMNNRIKEQIQDMRQHFSWHKKDTTESMARALLEESQELVDSFDVYEKAFQAELADVFMYALSIVYDQNYDLEQIISQRIIEVMKREY